MSLVLIVYLIGVLPTLASGLSVIGGFGSFLMIGAGAVLAIMSNFMTCYSWDDKEEHKKNKAACGMWSKRAFLASTLTLFIALVANLIPSEKTMYYMVAAYGVEKVVANPDVQALASDGADVLKQLMAKAKKELQELDDVKPAK